MKLRFDVRDKVKSATHGDCIIYATKFDKYIGTRLTAGSLGDKDYFIHKWPTEEEEPDLFAVYENDLSPID